MIFYIKLLLFYIELIVFAFVLAGAYHWLTGNSKLWRFLALPIFSIILVFVSFALTNDPAMLGSEYGEALINRYVSGGQAEREKAKSFINQNFIFIDNAFDKVLVPAPVPGLGNNAVIPVTNRKALYYFFNWCLDNSKDIDLLVCDIGFSRVDTSAQLLRPLISQLAKGRKFILSDNEDSLSLARQMPRKATALATAQSVNDRFNAQVLFRHDSVTLAYAVYQKIDSVAPAKNHFLGLFSEVNKISGKQWCFNTFPPVLYLNDDLTHFGDSDTLQSQFPGITIHKSGNYFLLNDYDEEALSGLLKEHKANGGKNILFLGTFQGQEDLHTTIFGRFHGPAILLNTIYNLHIGNHAVGAGSISILFLGYILIGYLVTFGCLIGYENKLRKRLPAMWGWEKKLYTFITGWHFDKPERTRHKWGLMIEVLIEFLFLFMLALMTWLDYYFCGVYINIIGLSVFLLLFRSFLIFFHKLKKIRH